MDGSEKPFPCNQCNEKFTNIDHLDVHRRKHTLSLDVNSSQSLNTPLVDQTPTPSKALHLDHSCNVSSFTDALAGVQTPSGHSDHNPFVTSFKRASEEARKPSFGEPFSHPPSNSDDSLNTPVITPNSAQLGHGLLGGPPTTPLETPDEHKMMVHPDKIFSLPTPTSATPQGPGIGAGVRSDTDNSSLDRNNNNTYHHMGGDDGHQEMAPASECAITLASLPSVIQNHQRSSNNSNWGQRVSETTARPATIVETSSNTNTTSVVQQHNAIPSDVIVANNTLSAPAHTSTVTSATVFAEPRPVPRSRHQSHQLKHEPQEPSQSLTTGMETQPLGTQALAAHSLQGVQPIAPKATMVVPPFVTPSAQGSPTATTMAMIGSGQMSGHVSGQMMPLQCMPMATTVVRTQDGQYVSLVPVSNLQNIPQHQYQQLMSSPTAQTLHMGRMTPTSPIAILPQAPPQPQAKPRGRKAKGTPSTGGTGSGNATGRGRSKSSHRANVSSDSAEDSSARGQDHSETPELGEKDEKNRERNKFAARRFRTRRKEEMTKLRDKARMYDSVCYQLKVENLQCIVEEVISLRRRVADLEQTESSSKRRK